jgi:O-antigen/teichoic acid export membrane protein
MPAKRVIAAPPPAKNQLIRASVWTLGGYGAGQAVRFGGNLILTRILFPGDFGIMALIQVFMQGLQMFSDIGIGPNIIQSSRGDDPLFLNTAWTVQVIRGWALWIAATLLAWPFAQYYSKFPHLLSMIPVAAFVAVISGFNSTSLFTQNRRLALGRLTVLNLGSQLVSIVVVIVLAYMYRSVWAFIAGGLISAAFIMALSHLALPGARNRFCWDRESRDALLGFGKWIFISTILSFLALQLDRLLLGKLVDVDLLGVYSVALNLLALPKNVASRFAGAVLYPFFARQSEAGPNALAIRVRQTRGVTLALGLVISLSLALGSPLIFRLLYDSRYADAGWMGQLLSIYMWFSLLQESSDRALLACGDSRAITISNLANLLVTAVGCLVGYKLWQMSGFIVGLCASSLAGHLVIQIALRCHGINIFRQDAIYTLAAAVLGGIGILGTRLASTYAPNRYRLALQFSWPALIILAVSIWALLDVKRQFAKSKSDPRRV